MENAEAKAPETAPLFYDTITVNGSSTVKCVECGFTGKATEFMEHAQAQHAGRPLQPNSVIYACSRGRRSGKGR